MIKSNNYQNRNKLDIILTDLQPRETPQIYTMEFFYNFLIENKSIDRISKIENKNKNEKGITCSCWHAAPLKFHILKDNNELREISYVNLVSMIQVCLFLDEYENDILDLLSNESFSIRYHRKRKDLLFLNAKKNKIEYMSSDRIKTKEASGDYYDIVPYKRLDYFYKSEEWFDLNRKYYYFGKIDYAKCFDSIYTHTFNWIIADNIIDAKKFNKKHFLSATDRLMQNINMSITNGIIVGPEFSRFISEIILQAIDSEVIKELYAEGFRLNENYVIKRYIDDIFVFGNDEKDIDKISRCIRKISSKYKLTINEEKKTFGKLPHIWSGWVSSIQSYIAIMIEEMFHPITDVNYKYIIKERNLNSINKIAKLKELFQNVIISDTKMNVKIVSYTLSTLLNKLNTEDVEKYKKTLLNSSRDITIYNIFDIIMYIYSFAPTFSNTEKLISIVHFIENEIGSEQCTKNLREILKRYNYIFQRGNISDYSNLLLLCAMKKIDIGISIETSLILLKEEANPILYAVDLIYRISVSKDSMKTIETLEKLISEHVEILNITDDIFLNNRIWWVLTFYNCPYLSSAINTKMKTLFQKYASILNNDLSCDAARKEVIDFYLESNGSYKIINWNISKEIFYQDIIFKTFKRTMFNSFSSTADDGFFDY